MINKRILIWYRNDLRTIDNQTLSQAIKDSLCVIPFYCFDEKQFSLTSYGFSKTGKFRTQFLLETVANLKYRLSQLGGDLYVTQGNTVATMQKVCMQYNITHVYFSKEVATEEITLENEVQAMLVKNKIDWQFFWTSTLLDKEDLPFPLKDIPTVFTNFKSKVINDCTILACIDEPKNISIPNDLLSTCIPCIDSFGLQGVQIDNRAAIKFKGGQSEAINRLSQYFFTDKSIKNYKETRNELIGSDYSTKFSPWLANGSLSARYVYHELKKFEQNYVSNDSTYWLYFELLWRDYFRFVFVRYDYRFFLLKGIKENCPEEWSSNKVYFEKWKNGKLQVPFIDANMRELNITGYMSNRGRQNVASYLAHDLKVNWLMGAAYFESMLIDYDVCSNYANWAYIAGVGNDPRLNRKFNIDKQAKQYDPQSKFQKLWLET